MSLVLFALLLGLVTYWVIRRRVASLTSVPLWILWLVMMTPVLTFTVWMLLNNGQPPPTALLYGLMILSSLVLYTILTMASVRERQSVKASEPTAQTTQKTDKTTKTPLKKPAKPITQEEETLLQRCFPWSIYYLQNIEYLPQAMICKGKLKSAPEEAYSTVQKNVESKFGDRFLVLFQQGRGGSPFFALVPNPHAKQPVIPESATPAQAARLKKMHRLNKKVAARPFLAFVLAILTLLTTTYVGAALIGGFRRVAELTVEELLADPDLLSAGFSYGLSLMVILGVHETGHYLATRYHRLKATLPYFIPVPFFLGTLGAFIQMRSPIPNRRALFDVGIAGPLAGLLISLPILGWGIAHSSVVTLGETSQLLSLDSLDPSRSMLLLIISKLALGAQLQATSAIDLHPLAISGGLGLIITALNLMPVGQLDGGHIVHAMYGQKTAAIVGNVARLLMVLLACVYHEFLLWAFLLLFVPAAEPALNDVSELNDIRDFLGLLSLAILITIILPAPVVLKGLLL